MGLYALQRRRSEGQKKGLLTGEEMSLCIFAVLMSLRDRRVER